MVQCAKKIVVYPWNQHPVSLVQAWCEFSLSPPTSFPYKKQVFPRSLFLLTSTFLSVTHYITNTSWQLQFHNFEEHSYFIISSHVKDHHHHHPKERSHWQWPSAKSHQWSIVLNKTSLRIHLNVFLTLWCGMMMNLIILIYVKASLPVNHGRSHHTRMINLPILAMYWDVYGCIQRSKTVIRFQQSPKQHLNDIF